MNLLLRMKYSFYSALVFLLCANPETYKILQKYLGFGVGIANPQGCPTPIGLLVSTVLFFLVMLSLMMFPRN